MRDDLLNAIRSLRSSRSFTIVSLIVLALGIGSATAIFSVVDAVVLRGLPFDEYDRLVAVYDKETKRAVTFGLGTVTPQTYLDWRSAQQPFEALAATGGSRYRLPADTGEPIQAMGQRVSWEFFPVLRVSPLLGRTFTKDDEVEGGGRVAILSYGFWQRRFGGAPDIVGRTITLSDQSWEVVGVMPPDFTYPVGADQPAEILAPLVFTKSDREKGKGRAYFLTVIGRLKPGVSIRQAGDAMERLSARLDEQFPAWAPGRRAVVVPLHDHLVGTVRSWMLLLLGAVGLVLLIACANVANLMLARATVRGREMGIRAALGASPSRLVRGLLVEAVVLSLAGAIVGITLASFGVEVLRAWLPPGMPRVYEIALDARVVAVAVAAAVVTGILFGIVPALHSARPDLTTALKDGGRAATAGASSHRLRNVLVVAEVALAVVLLVGAGLFTGSFVQLLRVDPGFDYHNVLTLNIGLRLPTGQHIDDAYAARTAVYTQQVLEAVARVPGVQTAAAAYGGVPFTSGWARANVSLPGRGEQTIDDYDIDVRDVTPGYLELMRIPLRRGRYLVAGDAAGSQNVVVINEAAARKYWNGADPLGQHITINSTDRVVVGIVGNIHHLGPEIAPRQECYIAMAQARVYDAMLVARTAGDPMQVLPAVKAAIWSVNREQILSSQVVTLDRYLDRFMAQRRFNMAVLALLGALGLVIAAVGIYGVMAYLVTQRTTEIGVRMALGATRGAVVAMVLRRASLLLGAGLLIGGIASYALSASVKSFLFNLQPTDPRIFGAALVVLALAGLAATALPARRAAGVDPLVALRTN